MIAGRYRLEREIGRGGAGVVHLAHDEVLGRSVAVKRIGLLPGTTVDDIARAEREGRLAAGLNHPHVVSIFDLVKDEDCYWLVMELVEGRSLSEVLADEGPLHPRRAAGIIAQAADALVQAGKAGIVHRDVKPGNIMVNDDDHVKLGDFGIARSATDAALTQTGLVTGSPAYIAPEVASGQQATAASDVWSLGATLWHALVGQPPYDVGSNVLGGLYKIVNDDPPRLPPDHPLAGLLAVMMTKDPGRRWSALQVRDDLRNVARGQRSAAPSPTSEGDGGGTTVAMETTRTAPAVGAPVPPVPAVSPTGQRPSPPSSARPSSAPAATPPSSTPSRRRPLGWIAALAALVLVAGLGAWLLWPEDGERSDTTAAPSGQGETSSPADEPSESDGASPSPTDETDDPAAEETAPETDPETDPGSGAGAAEGATAASMQSFVEEYFALVTSDPRTTFEMLTPEFQAQSGGYGRYAGFWSTIDSATPYDFEADPETLVASYTIDYVTAAGGTRTQQGSLQLTRQGDEYLIAGEG